MAIKQPPKPRKHPKQSRSQLLVDAILEACEKNLYECGPRQLTTQRIADTAGISIASLYQYFPNKEAILAEVFEKNAQQCAVQVAEKILSVYELAKQSLEQALAVMIEVEALLLIKLYELHPDFYREYHHSYDFRGRVDEIILSKQGLPTREGLQWFLKSHKNKLRNGDIRIMSILALSAIKGGLRSALDEDPTLLRQDLFKQELLTLVTNYLLDK